MENETSLNTLPTEHPLYRPYMVEAQLGNEDLVLDGITQLWGLHRQVQSSVKSGRDDLRVVGNALGHALYSMKLLLAKPGRNGQWSEFLRNQQIPRTTADRLVSKFERSLSSDSNCTSGAECVPPDVAIRKLLTALWPKLRKVLTTREAVKLFVDELIVLTERAFDAAEQHEPESDTAVAPAMTIEEHEAVL